MSEEKREKTYTIRGIDPEVYEAFSRVAKNMNVSIGKLLNEAMKMMISLISVGSDIGIKLGKLGATVLKESTNIIKSTLPTPDVDVITGIKELEVSRTDLESTEKPVMFLNIDKLIFKDDVDWDLIERKVRGIRLVDELVVPEHIPKLLLAKKCSMVGKIVTRSKTSEGTKA